MSATWSGLLWLRELLRMTLNPHGLGRLRRLTTVRYSSGFLLAFIAVAGALAQQEPSGSDADADLHTLFNAERASRGLAPVAQDTGLDQLAQQQLEGILATRNLIPPAGRNVSRQVELARLVAESITAEDGWAYRHNGLVVSYGVGIERTLNDVFEVQANRTVLFDPVLDVAGLASAEIPPGAPWLAPPVGGSGPPVELTGYTLVVIVMAGDF
jgi:hypothetical protein